MGGDDDAWLYGGAPTAPPAPVGHNRGPEVAWEPFPEDPETGCSGSQVDFIECPVFEVLLEGERGGGKTDCLIMDFAQHVGVGWGAEWRGILFRQTYKQLSDVVAKTTKWFRLIFPGATFNKQEFTWTFPGGEQLLLRHMNDPEDYWNYHGHAYPWIGWEELSNWATPDCFKRMMSCSRSTVPRERRDRLGRPMPRKYRATTNPYGPGHNWIKRRYRLPAGRGAVIRDSRDSKGNLEPPRVAIFSRLRDNPALLRAEPDYRQKVLAAARNEAEQAAWEEGSWDVTSGGMFDDIWDEAVHVVDPFEVPASWRLDRSFDWGSSKPFSVGFWAESDGTPYRRRDGSLVRTVRGDLFRINEWYGCEDGQEDVGLKMEPEEIADGIRDVEARMASSRLISRRVAPGPADSAIWTDDGRPSQATKMAARRVTWTRADKGAGSRSQGFTAIRGMLKAAKPPRGGGPREEPGLFVFRTCHAWLRTVPSISRDGKNVDDTPKNAEDHALDETRYRVRRKGGSRQRQL